MGHTKFQTGVIISATSFVDEKSFDVQVISSRAVADGGTAKIFLGRVAQSSAIVALKLFVLNMAEYEEQLLNRELRAARRVQHPFILPYTGTAIFEFHKILVSPYMGNGNLMQYLAKSLLVTADRYLLIVQVATAVEFLHTVHKMAHGDLKCENVLISDEGNALLADFGLSTYIDKTDTSTTAASALRQQSSIQFAAPELLFGDMEHVSEEHTRPARKTPQTDVYAFGMMVVQAFSGRSPWPGCKSPEIMMKVHCGIVHPRPPNTDPPLGLCDEWWDGCIACWAHDPSSRPTITELLTMLTFCFSDPTEEAHDTDSLADALAAQHCLQQAEWSDQSSVSDDETAFPDTIRRRWAVYLADGISEEDEPVPGRSRAESGESILPRPWSTEALDSRASTPLETETRLDSPPAPIAGLPFAFDPNTHAFSLTSPHKVLYDQTLYPSAGHLIYALMFPEWAAAGDDDLDAVGCVTWSEYSRRHWGWDTTWMDQLDDVLYAKFTQHSAVRAQLFETGTGLIINDDAEDSFWGVGHDAMGNNHLGKALMRVRDRLEREGGRHRAL